MAMTRESKALQNEKVRYSLTERCRTFFKIGSTILALALPAGDTAFGGQEELSPAPTRDCSNDAISPAAEAYTRDKVAILSATLIERNDGPPKKEFGFEDPAKPRKLVGDTLEVMKTATCGAYQPEAIYFDYSVISGQTYEEFCAPKDPVVNVPPFIAAAKKSAEKMGYQEDTFTNTIVLADFSQCLRPHNTNVFAGIAISTSDAGDVLLLDNNIPVLAHELGHLVRGEKHGAGLHARHGFSLDISDGYKFNRGWDNESVLSLRDRKKLEAGKDAFNGPELFGGGIIAPEEVVEITKNGFHTINSLLSAKDGRPKLLALPIRDSKFNERLGDYLRLDNPQITSEELENNMLTHVIVELSETANSKEGLSVKAYAAHLGRDKKGILAPEPGRDVYRITKEDPLFISNKNVTEKSGNNFPRLQLPGYTLTVTSIKGAQDPSVGEAHLLVAVEE